jgi:hypothetical protein
MSSMLSACGSLRSRRAGGSSKSGSRPSAWPRERWRWNPRSAERRRATVLLERRFWSSHAK